MVKKVFLPNGIATDGAEYLTSRGYELVNGTGRDIATMIAEGKDADAILIGTQPFTKEVMDAMPNLKIIARNGVGYDSVDLEAASAKHIYTTITPNALSDSVAETTVTMILSLAKNFYNDSANMRADNWNYRKAHQGVDLKGKTIGILGYGRIGRLVISHLEGFGVHFLVYDPFAKSVETGKLVSREELFSQSDFISVHLPLLPDTKGSISTAEFKQMKKTARIVNLARGPIIDQPALIEALQNGEIAGAGLDVYDQEPLPMDSPLFKLENVELTPHIASNTVETRDRMAVDAASEIDRVLSDEKPQWPVNKF